MLNKAEVDSLEKWNNCSKNMTIKNFTTEQTTVNNL